MIIKKPNNDYINKAIDLLDGSKSIVKNNAIESKYNTYIASFGGSIIQSGLVATLMIFEANKEKKRIINYLFELLNKLKSEKINETNNFYYRTVKSYDANQQIQLRNDLVEMAVALKLAMRCYKQIDNKNE